MQALTHKSKDANKIVFMIILGCAVFIRIIAFLNSDNYHGIAAGKVVEAMRLVKHPDVLGAWIDTAHGPIHMYLIALAIKLFGNHVLVSQLMSFFMGIAFFIPYFSFLKLWIGKEKALISSFIVAFFSPHILYSILSTAESSFLFFLFCGIFFYHKYHIYFKNKELIWSALFMGFATMCRFEGGIFIVLLAIPLLKKIRSFVLFLSVASILPVFWMYGNYMVSGNFMQFLFGSNTVVKIEFQIIIKMLGVKYTFWDKLIYWPMQLRNFFGWPLFIFGIIGILKYGFQRNFRYITFLFLSALSFFVYKTSCEELAMQERYGMSLGLLFLPYSVLFFCYLKEKLNKRLKELLVLILLMFSMVRGSYLTLVCLPHTPYWAKQAALFLKENVKIGELVYIESVDDNDKDPLKLLSGLDLDCFIDYVPWFQKTTVMSPEDIGNLRFFVYVSKNELKNLNEVYRIRDCKIYKITRNNAR
ncbi:MAG: glycosyltransferase family 39 protein [Candidatus Omnitrophica bacterium]|nr:glycosyltransferase family 39 protein [Candidatus Omnitrophota bacterium]